MSPRDPAVLSLRADRSDEAAFGAALDRVAVHQLRRSLEAADGGYAAVVRAWNTAVELSTKDERSQVEQDRLKYARRLLRRHGVREMVA
jgi:hypothetical protein